MWTKWFSRKKNKSCRKSWERFLELKKKFGLNPDVVTCDEQDIVKIFHDKFEGETIVTQYCVENNRIDAYMPEYKIGVEIDEYNHGNRNSNYEKSRQLMMESHGITIIRTNPDDPNFDSKNLIVQIHICIKEAIKKQARESLIEDLSKGLLELEFKQHNAIKSKCLKWVVKFFLPNYKKWLNILICFSPYDFKKT